MVFGDLLQLPPVRMREVFASLSPKEAKMFFGFLPVRADLWKIKFQYLYVVLIKKIYKFHLGN